MGLWRNRQFRITAIVSILIVAVISILTAIFYTPQAAILPSVGEAVIILLYIRYTANRMQEIAALSDEVDRVLHGQTALDIEHANEGELYILYSELQKMTLRLISQADQLKEDKTKMSQAMADISHQLRTPLTAMNLTANLLSGENLSNEERHKYVHQMKESIARMSSLVEALLKMARLDSGTVTFQKERIPVSDLIHKAAEPLQIPMELKEQTLHISCGNCAFTGDVAWCTEAVGNILKNCMEHTPVGGTVSVEAKETLVATEILIRDTGPGFTKKDLPHLFDRFYSGENASPQSIGIGLAMAKEIIQAQHGTIRAYNADERGAAFAIKFYKLNV